MITEQIEAAVGWLRAELASSRGLPVEVASTDLELVLERCAALEAIIDATGKHVTAAGGPWRDGGLDVAVEDMAAELAARRQPIVSDYTRERIRKGEGWADDGYRLLAAIEAAESVKPGGAR